MSIEKDTPPHAAAIILRFPGKRGRPKSARKGLDNGTPELVRKRQAGETTEALDLCFERKLISREQHWCGIHLRWLYTLRHGAPGVRALDPTHLGGIELTPEAPEWRYAREKEYNEAMYLLSQSGHALVVMNICVHNERPRFLSIHQKVTRARADDIERTLRMLCDGLDVLVKHWRR